MPTDLRARGFVQVDNEPEKRYLKVNVTKAQLDAQRAYNKDDYVANRTAERLVVGM